MGDIPVFTRLETAIRTHGGTVVAWELDRRFRANSPFTFTVKASKSGVGDWTTVATVEDTCLAVDAYRHLYGVAPLLFYQVTLTDADGNTYDSKVHQMIADFNPHDTAIIRDTVRKENLRNMKFAGQHGYLLKRRRWGEACTACTDFDSDEVINAKCTVCYGTGFVGGYFEPVHYWISPSEPGKRRRTTTQPESQGVVEDRVRQGRGMNCPWLDTEDLWIESNSDRRYIVQSVGEITYRGLAIIFDPIELRLAPATDIVYSVPLDILPSSSSAVSDVYQGNPVMMRRPGVRTCNCR